MSTQSPIGILFAAGESRRLGQPKQLVQYKEEPLVTYIAQVFLRAFPGAELIVVTGANSEAVTKALKGLPVTIVLNTNWRAGLSSSIQEAKRYVDRSLAESEKLNKSFILFSCDQYLLSEQHLRNMWEKSLSTKQSTFTRYTPTSWGIPCCIGWNLLKESEKLSADKGLKALLKGSSEKLSFVDEANLSSDLDTPEDLEKISAKGQ